MSMDRCVKCERYVDTDFDLQCYNEIGKDEPAEKAPYDCICESCRERLEEEKDARVR